MFEVTVKGADTKEQAKTLAKSVVCSNLTKAAIAGHDANWGRILCAMGYSGAEFDPEKVDLYFKSSAGELKIIENGVALDYSEEKATEILSMPEVTAIADLGQGEETEPHGDVILPTAISISMRITAASTMYIQ